MANGAINTTFFQLVAAFFIAFILGHMATKYFERFERFPSPLVTPGPLGDIPGFVQGRDYIPHRFKPTLPPGPMSPFPRESDATIYETTPPTAPMPVPMTTAMTLPPPGLPTTVSSTTGAPKLPYAMTSDDYLAFLTPDRSLTLTPTQAP